MTWRRAGHILLWLIAFFWLLELTEQVGRNTSALRAIEGKPRP